MVGHCSKKRVQPMYIERDIQNEFLTYTQEFPLVLLTGMRQCGKSTMLKHLAKRSKQEHAYVTLDDLEARQLAKSDPTLFFQIHKPPLIIDEVQYAPELFSALKMYADEDSIDLGSIWLSGSQTFSLMKLAGESLAGRVGILHMSPLSQHEIYGQGPLEPIFFTAPSLKKRLEKETPADASSLFERIFNGGMPAHISGKVKSAEHYYASFVQTYLERDVRDLDSGADVLQFMNFLRAIAAQTGQLLNLQTVATELGIARAKAHRWLSILEQSDVIFLLQPYSNNLMKRAVKTPKVYFNDPGMAAWLGRWTSAASLEAGALSGHILENYVIAQVRMTLQNLGTNANLWFYRDKEKKEVDLLVEQNRVLHPIEIKKSARPHAASISAFATLENKLSGATESKGLETLGEGLLVSLYPELTALTDKCFAYPAWGL